MATRTTHDRIMGCPRLLCAFWQFPGSSLLGPETTEINHSPNKGLSSLYRQILPVDDINRRL
jgi:hypothetical protein